MQIRNRIKELRHVPASDLRPNPKNWRVHPSEQRNALQGILAEVGYADALLARELPDGTLELIDGHLRAETTPDQVLPVLVLDVTAHEADQLLATVDAISAMASTDQEALARLAQETEFRSDAVRELLESMIEPPERKPDERPKRELEITPELFERQDYLVVAFDNQWDWQVACERLGIDTVANTVVDKTSTMRQKGLGRVITGERLLRELGYGQ